ncbi:hypothetical protein WL89_02755 [Burkholderia cenocepacia]|nr:hypothetical protein WL89_02755 [Burkholderia cenocepacia]
MPMPRRPRGRPSRLVASRAGLAPAGLTLAGTSPTLGRTTAPRRVRGWPVMRYDFRTGARR